MPRRSGGGGSRPAPVARARSPASNVPARAPQHAAPVPAAPAPAAIAPQPRQPGMFAQMATTAAGVAVGSAVGHTLGAAMTGGMGGHRDNESNAVQEQAPAPVQTYYNQPQSSSLEGGACQMQLKQFLECTQNQTDISLCQGFNEALRECKVRYGATM